MPSALPWTSSPRDMSPNLSPKLSSPKPPANPSSSFAPPKPATSFPRPSPSWPLHRVTVADAYHNELPTASIPAPPATLQLSRALPRRHHLHQRLHRPQSLRPPRSRQPHPPTQHHARLHRPHHQRNPPRSRPRTHHRSCQAASPSPHLSNPSLNVVCDNTTNLAAQHLYSQNQTVYPSLRPGPSPSDQKKKQTHA